MSGLILIVVVVAIGVGIGMIQAMIRRKGKYGYSKKVRWIIAGYFTLLFICAGLDAVLPEKKILDSKIVKNEEVEKEGVELYQNAVEGRIDQIDQAFLNKEWAFDYRGQSLTVAIAENVYTQIIVERKKTNDDKVEATFYQTRSTVNGRDFTELIHPPRLELEGEMLTVKMPKKTKIDFVQFENVFPVSQFTGKKRLGSRHSSFYEGLSVLYLQVPKNLELVDNPEYNFQFVE